MPVSINTANNVQAPDEPHEPSAALRELMQIKPSQDVDIPDAVNTVLPDIETLGRLVAPIVNREIGRWAVNERYSG